MCSHALIRQFTAACTAAQHTSRIIPDKAHDRLCPESQCAAADKVNNKHIWSQIWQLCAAQKQ